MGYQIIFKKRFAKNLLNVLTYLDENWGKRVADEFQDRIIEAIELLKQHPYIGAPSSRVNVRGLLITKHNKLFYRLKGNTIIIIALMDTRRKNYRR